MRNAREAINVETCILILLKYDAGNLLILEYKCADLQPSEGFPLRYEYCASNLYYSTRQKLSRQKYSTQQ